MGYRDKEVYNAYMKVYMLNRYHERMKFARERLGNRCSVEDCPYDTDMLELDHIDRWNKSFSISKMWSVNWDKFLKEVDKCQLLCPNHHQEKTFKLKDNWRKDYALNPRPCGTITKYTHHKCRCDKCKAAMREYKCEKRNRGS